MIPETARPDKYAQMSDNQLRALFAKKEGIPLDTARTFVREHIIGMLEMKKPRFERKVL